MATLFFGGFEFLPGSEMDEQLHTKEEDSVFPFISESDS